MALHQRGVGVLYEGLYRLDVLLYVDVVVHDVQSAAGKSSTLRRLLIDKLLNNESG